MLYSVALSQVYVWSNEEEVVKNNCTCKQARVGCRPAYVFSVSGQTGFRTALNHLKVCNSRPCQSLKKDVYQGIYDKLRWLLKKNVLLGCVQIQPILYGNSKVILKRRDFPVLAHHLANCPKESCSQLRRALLLNVRDRVGARNMPQWKREL